MHCNIILPIYYYNAIHKEKIMFAADRFIDTVQDSKKYFVSTFVTDEQLKKPLFDFIEAQRQFTKAMVKTGNDVMSIMVDSFIKNRK